MLTLNLTNSFGDSPESVAEQARVIQAVLGLTVTVDGVAVKPAEPVISPEDLAELEKIEVDPVPEPEPEPPVVDETPQTEPVA